MSDIHIFFSYSFFQTLTTICMLMCINLYLFMYVYIFVDLYMLIYMYSYIVYVASLLRAGRGMANYKHRQQRSIYSCIYTCIYINNIYNTHAQVCMFTFVNICISVCIANSPRAARGMADLKYHSIPYKHVCTYIFIYNIYVYEYTFLCTFVHTLVFIHSYL